MVPRSPILTFLAALLLLSPSCRFFRDREERRAAREARAEEVEKGEKVEKGEGSPEKKGEDDNGEEVRKKKAPKKGDHAALADPKNAGPLAEKTGVLTQDAARAAPGRRLVVSGHAPEVLELDLAGAVTRTWTLPPEHRRPSDPPSFRRVVSLADGGLAALLQGAGLVRFKADGTVAWRLDGRFHHGLDVAKDGALVALLQEPQKLNQMARDHATLVDHAAWVTPDGKLDKKLSLLGALVRSEHWHLMPALDVPDGDVMHTSSLDLIDAPGADPAFAVGNLIVTVPVIDAVLVFSPAKEAYVWAMVGAPLDAPQGAELTTQGLLVLDNQAGPSSARLFDVATRQERRTFTGTVATPFSTPSAGATHLLSNGDLLLVSTHEGRATELSPANEVVWTWQNPRGLAGDPKSTAPLYDMLVR